MKKILLNISLAISTLGFAQTTIFDIINSSEDHTTLAAAVQAAGLVQTLNAAGPFTVFAPT
ncbi:MAG: fasciclin domain-containing protein, partial [Flavobacteriales bacterium]|nr:fasciclin domain-containing protein [Flavobacteriales bacterium]